MRKLLLFTLALFGFISVWSADVAKNVTTGTGYSSLQAAISAASANDEIQLLSNITISPSATGDYGGTAGDDYYVSGLKISKNLTIDLNGKSITASAPSASCYFFTITAGKVTFTSSKSGSTINGAYGGVSDSNKRGTGYWGLIVPQSSSEVNISNIEFSNGRDNPCIKYEGTSYGVVDGCSFTSNSYRGGGVSSASSPTGSNEIIVRNCTANLNGYYGANSAAFSAQSGGKLTVESGEYSSQAACVLVMNSGGTITIKGGTFTAKNEIIPDAKNSKFYGAILVDANGTIIAEGGTFIGKIYKRTSGTLKINGGVYNQDGVYYTSNTDQVVSTPTTITSFFDPTKPVIKKDGKSYVGSGISELPTYTREGLTVDKWGTICLHRATSAYEGAKFYSIVKKTTDDQSNPCIELVEVEGHLSAGVPYLFQATATTLTCTYDENSKAVDEAQTVNGLQGTLINITTGLSGKYLLANNAICPASNDATLSANRAYIDLTQVPTTGTAPGRKVYMSTSGVNTPTGFDFIEIEAAASEKVIMNGKLFIRRGAQLFDAQGALVK